MTDRIAIVGMACRFPGAPDLDAYWRLLIEGRCAVDHFGPAEALARGARPDEVAHPDWVGAEPMLDGLDAFDAPFFRTSPREATWMSPEQRLLLELAWTAFEDASLVPGRLRHRVGVFAGGGASVTSYLTAQGRAAELQGHGATLEHLGNDKTTWPPASLTGST
jgi:acyl transferase domain-containing protein